MAIQPDYIIHKSYLQEGKAPEKATEMPKDKVYPMTPGVWQGEAIDVLKMYDRKEGAFSPVSESAGGTGTPAGTGIETVQPGSASALTSPIPLAFDPAKPPAGLAETAGVNYSPEALFPHYSSFKFLFDDTVQGLRHVKGTYSPGLQEIGPPLELGAPADSVAPAEITGTEIKQPSKPKDIESLTGGTLYDPARSELKSDNFPDRMIYWEGGLYGRDRELEASQKQASDLRNQLKTEKDPAKKAELEKKLEAAEMIAAERMMNSEKVKQHENAPNYRQMPGKPIHGVGQPTKQGFEDVVKHVSGSKNKPVVWADMRAEAVIYVDGKPYNLRQLQGGGNLDLKKGASAEELEAAEEKLKQSLINKGEIELVEEKPVLDANGKPALDENKKPRTQRVTKKVKVSADNVQTTKEVVGELKGKGYNIEYKRIPVTDESSPSEADMDTIRKFVADAKKNHPKEDVQYVFNCHQGKGRTTTAMVTAGITLDGKSSSYNIPLFGAISFGDGKNQTEVNINNNSHVQNLRETVNEYKGKAEEAKAKANSLETQWKAETDPEKKAALEKQFNLAREKQEKYENNTLEFTKRYATLQKYGEYISKHGENCEKPTFEEWMNGATEKKDMEQKWAAINQYFQVPGATGSAPETAFA